MLNNSLNMNKNTDINDEWLAFMNVSNENIEQLQDESVSIYDDITPPEPTPIYISTKSKRE